jgi:hypothetical protein
MFTKDQARAAVLAHLRAATTDLPAEDELVVLDAETIEKSWGWVFFYSSKRWLETGEIRYALAGNAPLIFERATGRMLPTGTALQIASYIDSYENERARG